MGRNRRCAAANAASLMVARRPRIALVTFAIGFAFFFTDHRIFRCTATKVNPRFVFIFRSQGPRRWNTGQQELGTSTAAYF